MDGRINELTRPLATIIFHDLSAAGLQSRWWLNVTTSWYNCSHFREVHRMERVGIRELKAHLSRHLKRVRAGARLMVTERGRSIATISPVETPVDIAWAHRLVAEGRAHWNGGKPVGSPRPVRATGERTVSDAVLEDRG
jgi:prevent-host-death family protein